MATILVAADASYLRDQLAFAFAGADDAVLTVDDGAAVRAAVAEHEPDLVVLDMQIGNMGGPAVALDLRLEEGAGRLPRVPILLLLDRFADNFLGRRSDVDAMLLKPVDAGVLRREARRMIGTPVH